MFRVNGPYRKQILTGILPKNTIVKKYYTQVFIIMNPEKLKQATEQ